MRPALVALLLSMASGAPAATAPETATRNDVEDERSRRYALTGATVVPEPGVLLRDAMVLIADGRIVSVQRQGSVPPGFAPIVLPGRYVYPGLIDVHGAYGLPDPPEPAPFSFTQPEVLRTSTPGAFNANEAIRSHYDAVSQFTVDAEAARDWRSMGFGAVLTFTADGIARGSGALVTLGEGSDNTEVLVPRAAAFYAFDKGSSKQNYPFSPMGAAALLRQTFLDAAWFARQDPPPFTDESLTAWNRLRSLPQIFTTRSWLEALRADRIGDEFGLQYVLVDSGDAYQRLDAIAATGATLVVPVRFPEPADVDDPFVADRIDFATLAHWERAPGNPAALEEGGVRFAITSGGDAKGFRSGLRAAIDRGLSERAALAALTTVPAELLRQEDTLGRLAPGALANLLVTSGPLFAAGTVVEENWIAGVRYVVDGHAPDRSGRYALSVGERAFDLRVSGSPTEPEAHVLPASGAPRADPIDASLRFDEEGVTLAFAPEEGLPPLRLGGWIVDGEWAGEARLADGTSVPWRARRTGDLADADAGTEGERGTEPRGQSAGPIPYPFTAYGTPERPQPQDLLIRGATVWTLEDEGVLDGADVLVQDGRIAAVARSLRARGARVVDGRGMHLTPGIIDEHSHIALSAVNDVATNSSMVRMADAVDPTDIDIYRNLAGGVTAAQLLHGSANPIGGQSALVKMRWGALPEEMLIEGADGFIKFALGENVKRSRNPRSIRYPQTRMGVEQVFRGAFTAARAYRDAWARWRDLPRRERVRTPPPRRDLAMEAMVEILEGERFVTCHSYVQSEINMLMHVAEDFGFRVNTFTHILEGYKVADRMAAHGAAGSTFSDWWAYKWEVRYAIPYNAALMHGAGVTTAINSDDREMSRRLNQEAAKTVKYGGVPEVDALKMVTLNPARMLHLDDRMGSIRVGKDADLVLWTDHPLSIDARVDLTIVDGAVLYDARENQERLASLRAERARLIGKMLRAKADAGSGASGSPALEPPRRWQCDSLHGYEYLDGAFDLGSEGL